MKVIRRQFIDRKKTGRKLQMLREDNIELRRQVCGALKHDDYNCLGDCDACEFEMDNHISRKELAEVFGVSESVIFNWENGRTVVDYENLLFYCQLAHVNLNDIVVFTD
ncbi:MAG: helix-turn-helix domain-containing protein [Clostridiales bacterium]|nr:helix-turn-helix domain-containing protein [Clostridiales bacterium]